MEKPMRITVPLSAAFAAVSLFAAAASLPQAARAQAGAAATPDGQLRLTGGAIAAGIGYVWGSGRLDFGGGVHPVKISGLSIVDVGAAKIDAHGSVYNLKTLSDFNGTYTTFAAGATIAGGGGVAYLRNQNGVVIRLDSATEGLRFNLSASGVTLKVKS
jgi:outer membrane immunogenic protein